MSIPDDSLKPDSTDEHIGGACKASSAKRPYKAYELSSEVKRHLELRVRFPDPAESPSYATLTNIRHEWRFGAALTLSYGKTMMVAIRGENLTGLYEAIRDGKADWIAEFNDEDYELPTDETAPFIKSITIHTTRLEDTPPAGKLH